MRKRLILTDRTTRKKFLLAEWVPPEEIQATDPRGYWNSDIDLPSLNDFIGDLEEAVDLVVAVDGGR